MAATAVDVDKDQDLDLVVAREFAANRLFINDGLGRFSEPKEPFAGAAFDSEDLVVLDVNNDGWVDVLFVSEDNRNDEFYLGTGPGQFTRAFEWLPPASITNGLAAGDINEDARIEVFLANNGQNTAWTALDERWEPLDILPVQLDVSQSLALGDLDGDGDLDMVVANEDTNRILLLNPDKIYSDAPDRLPLRSSPEETREVVLGDVDSDGDLDIFFANTRLFIPGAIPQNRLLLNEGDGYFTDVTETHLPPDEDRCMTAAFVDLDDDGHLDIITGTIDDLAAVRASEPYRTYLNNGSGMFTEVTTLLPALTTGNGFAIVAAQLDNDATLDLFFGSRGGPDRLLLSQPPENQ